MTALQLVTVALAVIGAALIVVGVGMIYTPAGVICAGVIAAMTAYVAAYLKAGQ